VELRNWVAASRRLTAFYRRRRVEAAENLGCRTLDVLGRCLQGGNRLVAATSPSCDVEGKTPSRLSGPKTSPSSEATHPLCRDSSRPGLRTSAWAGSAVHLKEIRGRRRRLVSARSGPDRSRCDWFAMAFASGGGADVRGPGLGPGQVGGPRLHCRASRGADSSCRSRIQVHPGQHNPDLLGPVLVRWPAPARWLSST